MYALLWISETDETPLGTYDSWAALLQTVSSLLPTSSLSLSLVRKNSQALCETHGSIPLFLVTERGKPVKYMYTRRLPSN